MTSSMVLVPAQLGKAENGSGSIAALDTGPGRSRTEDTASIALVAGHDRCRGPFLRPPQ